MNMIQWIAAFLFLLAGGLWFLSRVFPKVLWVPVLKLLEKGKPPRPKFTLLLPPFYWFFLFCLMGLVWITATFKPFAWKTQSFEKESSKTLIVVDKSVSVSRFVSRSDWLKTIGKIAKLQSQSGLVYGCSGVVKDSSAPGKVFGDVTELSSSGDVGAWLSSLDFLADAPLLNKLLPACAAALDDQVKVVVISDQDPYSWQDIQLDSLSKQQDFYIQDLSVNKNPSMNLFFQGVEALPEIGDQRRWQVFLKRSTLGESIAANEGGTVSVELVASSGESIKSKNLKSIKTMDVSLEDALAGFVFTEMAAKIPARQKLGFRIKDAQDSIALDNTHWIGFSADTKKMKILTDSDNETWIRANTRHLQAYWEAMGNRFSYADGAASTDVSVVLVEESLSAGVCSQDVEGKIWLAPAALQQSFDGVCRCFGSLVGQRLPCSELGSAAEWRDIILSSGGSQVGGEVGAQGSSFLYRYNSEKKDILFVLFPLRPSQALGLDAFPGFVRKITKWHLDAGDEPALSNTFVNVKFEESSSQNNYFKTSSQNIRSLDLVASSGGGAGKNSVSVKTRDEASWAYFLIFSSVVLVLLEALGLLVPGLRRVFYVVFVSLALSTAGSLEAQSEIVGLGVSLPATLTVIPQLVAKRTSMHIAAKTTVLKKLPASFSEPLLWSDSKRFSTTWTDRRKGSPKPNLRQWLQKGGTAVLHYDKPGLKSLQDFVSKSLPEGSWAPLGVDHEISKSYYLFAGLPSCKGQQLYEFRLHGRMAILLTPLNFLSAIETENFEACPGSDEQWKRLFVNTWMALLAMDYKKDQVHLPAILKRLR